MHEPLAPANEWADGEVCVSRSGIWRLTTVGAGEREMLYCTIPTHGTGVCSKLRVSILQGPCYLLCTYMVPSASIS